MQKTEERNEDNQEAFIVVGVFLLLRPKTKTKIIKYGWRSFFPAAIIITRVVRCAMRDIVFSGTVCALSVNRKDDGFL